MIPAIDTQHREIDVDKVERLRSLIELMLPLEQEQFTKEMIEDQVRLMVTQGEYALLGKGEKALEPLSKGISAALRSGLITLQS